jgi:MFS family permease
MQNNKKSIQLLFLSNGISGFAQGVSMLSIPWYFAKNNNSQIFNYAYAFLTFLLMFFGLYAGTLVDKFSRKGIFLYTSLVCGFFLFSIASYGYLNGSLPLFLVLSVFGITMLNYNIHYPTLYAFSQEISSTEQYKSVNSNIEIVGQSTSILSGGFAAMLLDGADFWLGNFHFFIHSWQIQDVFMMDAITYFLAAILIYLIPYTADKSHSDTGESLVKRLKNGFDYLKQNKFILIFGISSFMVFAMLLVEIHAVLPIYIKKHLMAKGNVFALADTIYAVGALSAGFFINKLFKSNSFIHIIIVLTLLVASIFFAASVSKSILVIYIVSIILGFCNAGIRVLRLTYMFKHVPNELMGRVGSIFNLINVFIRGIFIFIFSQSFFSYQNNIVYAYAIMSIFLILAGFSLYLVKNKLPQN